MYKETTHTSGDAVQKSNLQPRGARSMFYIFPALLIIVWAGFISCVKDDRSGCPDGTTLTIQFEYLLPDDTDGLPGRIENADLYIFDASKNLYASLPVDRQALESQRGITLDVDPGDYYLVAWANTNDAPLSGTPTTGSAYDNMQLIHDETAATIRPLYYAPDKRAGAQTDYNKENTYRIAVIENKNNVHVLPFMGAHHTVEVYIKGLEQNGEVRAAVNGMAGGYDNYLNLLNDNKIGFTSPVEAVSIEDVPMLKASFRIPHFTGADPVNVSAHYGDKLDASVQLQQYIEKNDIEVTDGNPAVIPILFEYREGIFMEVRFPYWLGNDVIGGF